MQRLQVQLVIGLDRHEPHRGPTHSLSYRFRIDVVTLVRLHVWLHILRRDQPNFMPLFSQCPAKEMSSPAGFHANQLHPKLRCETKQLRTRELLAHHSLAAHVKSHHVKNRLTKIQCRSCRSPWDITSVHLLYPGSAGQRRRTIPLVSTTIGEMVGCRHQPKPSPYS